MLNPNWTSWRLLYPVSDIHLPFFFKSCSLSLISEFDKSINQSAWPSVTKLQVSKASKIGYRIAHLLYQIKLMYEKIMHPVWHGIAMQSQRNN